MYVELLWQPQASFLSMGRGQEVSKNFVLISRSLEGQNKGVRVLDPKTPKVKYSEDGGYTAKTHSLCWLTFSPCAVLDGEPDSPRVAELGPLAGQG